MEKLEFSSVLKYLIFLGRKLVTITLLNDFQGKTKMLPKQKSLFLLTGVSTYPVSLSTGTVTYNYLNFSIPNFLTRCI